MKKFLSLVLALVMTMSLVTISAGAKDFTDADKVNYDEAIAVLSAVKVIDGYTDGSFKPQTPLNRGQAAKIICNLVLGPTTAAELSATVAPFSDVPANNIFAGYITYCANEGIICGYGDGTFRPTASLTGYAFLKMLLGALGYDAEIEGYNNPGSFGIQVAKQAIGIGLNKGLKDTFNGNKTVTREEACLYALNTLKATMVEYDQKIVANVNGAQVTVGTSVAQDVKWGVATLNDGNIKNDGFVQFAEKYFPKLELEITNGMYGRPANTWKNKKAEIGTFTSIEPTYVYTKGTKAKDVYKDLGKAVVEDYTWTTFINGEEVEVVKPTKNGDKDYLYTGEGAVTEIYVDADKETVVVCEINFYLGQVTKVKSDDDGEYITIKELSKLGAETPSCNLDEKTFYVEGYEEDDYVVFTVDFNDDDDYVIGEVFEPQTVTGEVKRVESDTASEKAYVKLDDGEKYEYSGKNHIVYDLDSVKEYHPELNKEYILYMDPNGYVLGFELAEDEVAQYLYVKDSDEEMNDWVAKVVLTDATAPKVDVKSKVKGLNDYKTPEGFNAKGFNKDDEIVWINGVKKDKSGIDELVWKYSTNDKGQYTLTYVQDQYKTTKEKAAEIHNGKSYVSDGKNNFIVDMKTVFVDVKGEKSYTGYKEVPNVKNATLVYVLDGENEKELDGKIAKVVFILEGDVYDENATYFVLAKDKRESGDYNDKNNYWEFSDSFVNGAKTPLKVTYDAVANLEKVDPTAVQTVTMKDGSTIYCLKAGILYKATKTVKDGQYIDEVEAVKADPQNPTKMPVEGEPNAVGDNAFWLSTAKDAPVKFDTDNETVYVTVRKLVDLKGKVEWKISDGNIKDLKALTNDNKTKYSAKDAMVVKAANDDNTARLVYIFWTETELGNTKTVTFTGDHFTVAAENATSSVAGKVLTVADKGMDAKFSVTADAGYELVSVKLDGVELKAKDGVYTIPEVTKDLTVEVVTKKTVTEAGVVTLTGTNFTVTYPAAGARPGVDQALKAIEKWLKDNDYTDVVMTGAGINKFKFSAKDIYGLVNELYWDANGDTYFYPTYLLNKVATKAGTVIPVNPNTYTEINGTLYADDQKLTADSTVKYNVIKVTDGTNELLRTEKKADGNVTFTLADGKGGYFGTDADHTARYKANLTVSAAGNKDLTVYAYASVKVNDADATMIKVGLTAATNTGTQKDFMKVNNEFVAQAANYTVKDTDKDVVIETGYKKLVLVTSDTDVVSATADKEYVKAKDTVKVTVTTIRLLSGETWTITVKGGELPGAGSVGPIAGQNEPVTKEITVTTDDDLNISGPVTLVVTADK